MEDVEIEGEGIPSVKIFLEEQGLQNRQDTAGDISVQEETEIWLRRQGVDKALVQGLGKGPDGIALAKVAAKRLKGKENGENWQQRKAECYCKLTLYSLSALSQKLCLTLFSMKQALYSILLLVEFLLLHLASTL